MLLTIARYGKRALCAKNAPWDGGRYSCHSHYGGVLLWGYARFLYHYTSEAGLAGILKSDMIRATHVRFLNDWTEFREAFTENYVQILLDAFRVGLPVDLPVDARRIIDGTVARRAAGILEIIERSEFTNETFVCSFTSAASQESADPGDRLSQWRGYAADSQGFSLGFDRVLLQERVEINNPKAKATLQQCVYDESEKAAFFEQMGRTAAACFNDQRHENAKVPDSFVTLQPDASDEYKKANYYFLWALSRATAEFFTTAACIKNAAFREEREWRVIFQAAKSVLSPINIAGERIEIVKFRDGQFGRTPYIEIPLRLAEAPTSPLRRIVVGPGLRKEEAKHAVELLLINRGIPLRTADNQKGVEIATSLIPFRAA